MTQYAVTAATGNFDQAAVKTLTKLVGKENIIVIARNTAKADKLFPGFAVRHGDYDDVNTLSAAVNHH